MKRFSFILMVFGIISISGCESKEEKANALIKESLFQTLYDFDSYQPIQTIIDTAFSTPFIDDVVLSKVEKMASIWEEQEDLIKQQKELVRDIEAFGFIYSRKELAEAKSKGDELVAEYNAKRIVYDSLENEVKDLVYNYSLEPIGWVAYHKFRCKTKGGSSDIGNKLYYFDGKVNTIIKEFDLDETPAAVGVLLKILMSSDEEKSKEIVMRFINVIPKSYLE